MSKFSVKKPLTVFVAVIAILVLGVVAYTKMTPDLLPNMDFPYVMIMTTYPGASPEKVEQEITKPLEQSMSTLEHIQEVSSTSAENVSMVILEFDDDVNMDTIGVDIQQKITTLSAGWDDMVGSPYVLKINPSMLPVEVAALSMDGMNTMELTDFLNDTLMNELEGIPGVARITATGMIEQELHVVLDQKLIDDLNQKIADAVNGELDDAAQELNEKKEELEDAKSEISSAESKLNEGADALIQGEAKLKEEKKKLEDAQEELDAQLKQAQEGKIALTAAYETLNALNEQVNNVVSLQQTAAERVAALTALQEERAQIEALRQEIEALEGGSGGEAPAQEESAAAEEETRPDAEESAAPEDAEAAAVLPEEAAPAEPAAAVSEAELAVKKAELAQLEAAHNAQLAAAGVTDETLDLALAGAQTELAAANAAVEQIDGILATQDTDRAGLAATVAETKQQLDQVTEGIAQLEAAQEQLANGMLTMEEAEEMLEQQKVLGMLQISTAAGKLAAGSASIEMALTQVESGLDTIEDSREDALRQADLNQIITMDMVTQILNAQNFAMPAGYVEQDGIHYMVSVGDEITDLETLQNLLLFDLGLEGVDPIYLKDVAVVIVTDNSGETYAKLNGQDGVMLSFEKQSTYATAEATNNIADRFRELEAEYPGLQFVSLMNQGDYIYIIVESILNSLLLGALFAVLILFLFLKDLRPTFITLCSIPISVIFAIVLMYFSGVTINMISLSGLAVAVGMLVDNS
ncbi:MAG: efflux RND transporter permease subunit, partial [Evtepia sp.]